MPVSATDLKGASAGCWTKLGAGSRRAAGVASALPPPDIHFRGQLERMLSRTGTSDEDLSLPALGMRVPKPQRKEPSVPGRKLARIG